MAVRSFDEAFALLRSVTNYERAGRLTYDRSTLDLGRTRRLLLAAGSPDRGGAYLHVAGSKGKGTVSEMLARGVRADGRRVGLFTSPHLRDLRERAQVDFRPIGKAAFARIVRGLEPALGGGPNRPTFFEILTAIALVWFRQRATDADVLEVGLGGRFDSTNVVVPRVSVITTISLEHTRYLGRTLERIAFEKTGIVKRRVPVVSGVPDASSPGRQIRRRARAKGAPLSVLGRDFHVSNVDAGPRGVTFDYAGAAGSLDGLRVPLLGTHQAANAAVAAEALAHFGIGANAIRRGLARVRAPGRCQVVARDPWIVVDGAHNVASVRATVAAFRTLPATRRVVVLGAMRDKKLAGILDEILPSVDRLFPVAVDLARARPAAEVAERARVRAPRGVRIERPRPIAEALAAARRAAGRDGAVLVTGSMILAGEVLDRLGI